MMIANLADCRRVIRHARGGMPFAELLSMALVAALAVGCSSTVNDKVMTGTGTGPSPVEEAKSLVQRYADGQPMGSEAMVFDELAQRVITADAAKGAKVKKFLDDTQKKGVDVNAAKALLKEL